MGRHLLIALSRHSEREFLVCCWVLFYCIALIGCLFSQGEYAKKRGSLEGFLGGYIRRHMCTSFMSHLSES